MNSDDRQRVLYGLRPDRPRYRRQVRLLAAAFRRAGFELDCLVGGPGTPRLVTAETLLDAPEDDAQLRGSETAPSATERALFADSPRRLRGLDGFDIDAYRLVLSESEPLSARVGRLAGLPVFGIGHGLDPEDAGAPFARAARWSLGRASATPYLLPTHWYPAHPTALPPLIDPSLRRVGIAQDYTLVRLPGEELVPLVSTLSQLRSKHFVVYSPGVVRPSQQHNVSLYPVNEAGFRHHLERANRLLCDVDVELVGQALHMGIPLMLKPGPGEPSQERSADALALRSLAEAARGLGILTLERFVESAARAEAAAYPDVAGEIVHHCLHEDPRDVESLAERLWSAPAPVRVSSERMPECAL